MNRIGLALSGGGFRATLYHLGLVRFLRDAGLLSQVTHITSVSGGSVFAAHLVLNRDLYNGSPNEQAFFAPYARGRAHAKAVSGAGRTAKPLRAPREPRLGLMPSAGCPRFSALPGGDAPHVLVDRL